MNEVPEQLPMNSNSALYAILLEHLQSIYPVARPGVDGLTLDVVLESYFQAAVAGQVPDKCDLLHLYPEFAAELEALFAKPETAPSDFSDPVLSPLYFEHTD
jgi:hypothetical protein